MSLGADVDYAADCQVHAAALASDEVGGGGVTLLLALEVRIKVALAAYAGLGMLDGWGREQGHGGVEGALAELPKTGDGVRGLAAVCLVAGGTVGAALKRTGNNLGADVKLIEVTAVCQGNGRTKIGLAEHEAETVVVEPLAVLAGKPLDEAEVRLAVLALIFYLGLRLGIDDGLHAALVGKFLNYI